LCSIGCWQLTSGDKSDIAGAALSPFQTNLPGVFAVGDVRTGSVKRVASAVGEGSVVVQAIHQHLANAQQNAIPRQGKHLEAAQASRSNHLADGTSK
jgi:hypothetical protein